MWTETSTTLWKMLCLLSATLLQRSLWAHLPPEHRQSRKILVRSEYDEIDKEVAKIQPGQLRLQDRGPCGSPDYSHHHKAPAALPPPFIDPVRLASRIRDTLGKVHPPLRLVARCPTLPGARSTREITRTKMMAPLGISGIKEAWLIL